MPLYEYACRGCGHQFEYLIRGDEKPSCPACGGKRLKKKLSVPAAHGTGGCDSCGVSRSSEGGCRSCRT